MGKKTEELMKQAERLLLCATAIGLILAGVGCSRSGLTRAQAKELIQKSFPPEECFFKVTGTTVEGMWREGLLAPLPYSTRLDLTPKGTQLFRAVGGGIDILDTADGGYVRLRSLERLVTEVTGITEQSPTAREVRFAWRYNWDAAPDEMKRLAAEFPKSTPHYGIRGLDRSPGCNGSIAAEGVAILKLYDDGWRVEEARSR